MKIMNGYVGSIKGIYDATPKAVLAAIAVSALTTGGDDLDDAKGRLLKEWQALFENGIVEQDPRKYIPRSKWKDFLSTTA